MLPARAVKPPIDKPHQGDFLGNQKGWEESDRKLDAAKHLVDDGAGGESTGETTDTTDEQSLGQDQSHDLSGRKPKYLEHRHLGTPFAHADTDGVGNDQSHGHQNGRHEKKTHAPQQVAVAIEKGKQCQRKPSRT